jgi:hypothetical protein
MNIKNCSTPTKRYKTVISAVHSIYRLVNSTFVLKDLISRLARLLCQIFNARYCLILLVDPSKKYSEIKVMVSGRKKIIIDKRKRVTNRLEKRIIRTFTAVERSHLMGIPLVSEDITGVIIIKRAKTEAPFEKADQELVMTMAEQAMIGVKSIQLYEEQQKIILNSIKSLTTLLDARVPQEYTHSPYFNRLVVALAQEMHLDDKQVESLKYASLLHDAGKIDVPLEILTKTTKLTPKEFTIIRHHPVMGVNLNPCFIT